MPKPAQMTSPSLPVACFAPPLTDEKLASYRALADSCPDAEVRDALGTLLACVAAWWELPESARTDVQRWAIRHRGKDVTFPVVPLEAEHVAALWDVTPWMRELNTLSNSKDTGLFDRLDRGELRDAAFHLLWFAKELTLDREPVTADKLPE